MNKLKLIILSLLLCSCATYKIEPEGKFDFVSSSADFITVKQENEWPTGHHCFEPMLYVLTLGIIPTHCVDTYKVLSESSEIGSVKITKVQGWVALFMAPFSSWQYGFINEPETEIMHLLQATQ